MFSTHTVAECNDMRDFEREETATIRVSCGNIENWRRERIYARAI